MYRALAAVMAGIALAPRALAQPIQEPVTLEWEAPRGCPSSGEVSSALGRLVARSHRTGAHLAARARVSRRGPHDWRVHLRMTEAGKEGERQFSAESCSALADAAVLVIALAFDPDIASSPAQDDDAGAPADPPPSDAPEPQASTARFHPANERPIDADAIATPPSQENKDAKHTSSWLLGGHTRVGFGDRPGASVGAGLIAGWTRDRFRLEVDAVVWAPRDATAPDTPSDGGSFQLVTLDLRACYEPVQARLRIAGCIGGHGGRLIANAFGTDAVSRGTETHLGAVGGLLLTWPLAGPLALRASADAVTIFSERRPFALNGDHRVFQASPVAAYGGLGLELHF